MQATIHFTAIGRFFVDETYIQALIVPKMTPIEVLVPLSYGRFHNEYKGKAFTVELTPEIDPVADEEFFKVDLNSATEIGDVYEGIVKDRNAETRSYIIATSEGDRIIKVAKGINFRHFPQGDRIAMVGVFSEGGELISYNEPVGLVVGIAATVTGAHSSFRCGRTTIKATTDDDQKIELILDGREVPGLKRDWLQHAYELTGAGLPYRLQHVAFPDGTRLNVMAVSRGEYPPKIYTVTKIKDVQMPPENRWCTPRLFFERNVL